MDAIYKMRLIGGGGGTKNICLNHQVFCFGMDIKSGKVFPLKFKENLQIIY